MIQAVQSEPGLGLASCQVGSLLLCLCFDPLVHLGRRSQTKPEEVMALYLQALYPTNLLKLASFWRQ